MSLPKGDDPKTIWTNIKIAQDNMHLDHKAAVAVALKQAGKTKQSDDESSK